MSQEQEKKIYAQELKEGHRFLINGQLETILRIIPMQNREGKVYDIELLLDKKQNRYFSYNMYHEGTSWVKTIERL